jgi:DNA-binding response OmpR family regulator
MGAWSATTEPQQDRMPQILLMEDETNVAKGLKLVLGEAGYEVDWAETGKSALELCRRKRYDLMLADLRLPDVDGMEVIKEVRRQWPQTGVIVITGYSTVDSAIEALKLGASDYLQKPFTDDEIKAAINEALTARAVVVEKSRRNLPETG